MPTNISRDVPSTPPGEQQQQQQQYSVDRRLSETDGPLMNDLRNYIIDHLMRSPLQMETEKASETAAHYVETLTMAGFNYTTLMDTITHFQPPEPNFEGEPVQTIYGHLLDCLYNMAFETYPKALSESHLDAHLTNIVRILLDYYSRGKSPVSPPSSPEPSTTVQQTVVGKTGFIDTLTHSGPVGGNMTKQLPPRKYILASVSVDTVSVEGQLVVWQISVYIPSLPDNKDPDYECLLLPHVLREMRPEVLADMGFIYDWERKIFCHQGPEFGRRLVDLEGVALEKFTNYLDEIRNGLHGVGSNNGLVLLFETGEDMALVQQLLSRHGYDIFLDVVKGVACLDHYLRVTRSARQATYSWPAYQYQVGKGGCWIANVSFAGRPPLRIEAETKPECIYNICETLLSKPPDFNNFIKWYSYPVNHSETCHMLSSLDHILELLPLQNHIEQQLNQTPVVLEGIYAARNEVEATRPTYACAGQTIRRLVSLGFTLDVLKKCFETYPKFVIPSTVFLQDMSEVQKLRVHSQTEQIREFIKQYFCAV